MRPVKPQPEPACFDARVRKRGLAYVKANPHKPIGKWPPYWREVSRDLWSAYKGVDAYYAYYFEFVTGVQVDHFHPKSKHPQLAYEWSNYRLTCSGSNNHKHENNGILDPFELREHSFFIHFADGEIYPNPAYDRAYVASCNETIRVLGLDDDTFNEARRMRFYEFYTGMVSLQYLQQYFPFVWDEICRQQLQHCHLHAAQIPFDDFVANVL